MFNIDTSYIDQAELESLQGKIWDIRSDNKEDPTLPRIDNYDLKEDVFDAYLDKKQDFEDWKTAWKKRAPVILVFTFLLPAVACSFSMDTSTSLLIGFTSGMALCLTIYLIFKAVEVMKKPKPLPQAEAFIKALLLWSANKEGRTEA